MFFKKQETSKGLIYVLSEDKCIYHEKDSLTLNDLNNVDGGLRIFATDMIANRFVVEYIQSNVVNPAENLPSGTYSVLSESYFDDVKLSPLCIKRDKIIFSLSENKSVQDDFLGFLNSSSVYKKLGLIYKRGILLFGPPGTGKTTAIHMILNKCAPKDSLIFFIKDVLPIGLLTALKGDPRLKIFIFEELTHQLEHRLKEFLNFLDGETSLDNMFVFATTNYPENLPGNLINRPGRFDKLIKIDYLKEKDREVYLKSLLGRKPTKEEIKGTKNLSIGHIKEMALSMIINKKSIVDVLNDIKNHEATAKNNFKEIDVESLLGD